MHDLHYPIHLLKPLLCLPAHVMTCDEMPLLPRHPALPASRLDLAEPHVDRTVLFRFALKRRRFVPGLVHDLEVRAFRLEPKGLEDSRHAAGRI